MKKVLVFKILTCTIALLLYACGGTKKGTSSAPLPFDDTVSFEATIKPLIENNCQGCHSGDEPAADLMLSSFEEIREGIEDGKVIKRINDEMNPMPPGELMPQAERDAIIQWMHNGYNK